MDTEKNNLLTPNQFTYLLLGFVVGTGFLKLPNQLVKSAGQDSWMCAIFALIYPLYVVLVSSYIINEHPKENILKINKKYFGDFFGNIVNFLFMLQFIITTVVIIAHTIIFSRVYIVSFLAPLKVGLITVLLVAYTSSKGISVLGKLNQLIFYMFIPVFLLSLTALKYGDILNIQPVFGGGVANILKTTPKTAYSYFGWECLLLLFPYVKETKSIKKAAFKAVGICGVVYVWVIFSTIYYLSIDITPKSYWSFIMVFTSINIPIINNFRYIFMFIWIVLSFRITANYYFAVTICINSFKKIDLKKIVLLILPIIIFLVYMLSDRMLRQKIEGFTYPASIIFNLSFITLVALLIKFKKKKNDN
ncbi:GerAB/ArcD/ProY family transporter [Oceanirhabdus sp. W0125-5]|uniref:GerAB/ArcD/ProY family transporter n=1 Tax=Oceanirhabdus sp. W0125-5 TaxID=2999116 RepID=UPI0022F32CA7|nr:endospore germination permease [Oceanirhabdus sp. W0125-5]WBW98350.1 endospore germination permease [Oceanirhabdus sp. W0125-5]